MLILLFRQKFQSGDKIVFMLNPFLAAFHKFQRLLKLRLALIEERGCLWPVVVFSRQDSNNFSFRRHITAMTKSWLYSECLTMMRNWSASTNVHVNWAKKHFLKWCPLQGGSLFIPAWNLILWVFAGISFASIF